MAAIAVAGFLALAGCGGGEPASTLPGGALYDPPRPAPALRLTDGNGDRYDLAHERGRVVLVFFGFTRCPDVCPATLQRWVQVRDALGPDASRVRFLFVSVDPERDTPAIAAAYAAGFDARFVGVSGAEREVGETALAWGVGATRAPGGGGDDGGNDGGDGDGGYDIVHASQVFVVDADGLLRWGYGRATTVEEIATGVRSLLPAER
jgi:protein SCO1/2